MAFDVEEEKRHMMFEDETIEVPTVLPATLALQRPLQKQTFDHKTMDKSD